MQNGNRQNPEMYGVNMSRGETRWSIPFMENIGNNDLYLKKYGQLFQVNFCNDQTNPNTAWNGFFHCQIDDVLFVGYSSNEDYFKSLCIVIYIENLFNCWKPLKLKLPKCENVLDVTMGNQQGSLFFI